MATVVNQTFTIGKVNGKTYKVEIWLWCMGGATTSSCPMAFAPSSWMALLLTSSFQKAVVPGVALIHCCKDASNLTCLPLFSNGCPKIAICAAKRPDQKAGQFKGFHEKKKSKKEEEPAGEEWNFPLSRFWQFRFWQFQWMAKSAPVYMLSYQQRTVWHTLAVRASSCMASTIHSWHCALGFPEIVTAFVWSLRLFVFKILIQSIFLFDCILWPKARTPIRWFFPCQPLKPALNSKSNGKPMLEG